MIFPAKMNNAFDQLTIVNHVAFVNFRQRFEVVTVGQHHPLAVTFLQSSAARPWQNPLLCRITTPHHRRLFLMKFRVREPQFPLNRPTK